MPYPLENPIVFMSFRSLSSAKLAVVVTVSAAALTAYLERLAYRLGPAEEAGLAAFADLLREETA